MAKGRHFFVCKDGNPLPEWLKLPGKVECLAPAKLPSVSLDPEDIVWFRLPPAEATSDISFDLIRRISGLARSVALADIPDDEEALAVFAAGVRGYCNSHTNSQGLKLITGVIQEGGLWIGESLMRRLVVGVGKTFDGRMPGALPAHVTASLTDREREVAETVAGGASNKEVARLLQISERTVKAHVTTIFNKLEVRDRLQLTIKIKMLK